APIPPHRFLVAVKRNRKLPRRSHVLRGDMQLDLEAIRMMRALLVQHHVPVRDEKQALAVLEEKASGAGERFLPGHRRDASHGEKQGFNHSMLVIPGASPAGP